ncbi:hypothetical protein Q8G40_28955, partial [Klebsiella pneumoniae]|uniref:hypothetical protein n=1 Tax=Klebsiella pneumoniae TaxID=573 RepID=UPI003013D978
AESDKLQAANTKETTQNTKSVINNQSITKDNDNQVNGPLAESKTKNTEVPVNNQDVKDTTKVVIHYAGDGNKWVPYVWGKKPNGNGNQ